MDSELGFWQRRYSTLILAVDELGDRNSVLLPTSDERADHKRPHAEQERKWADVLRSRAGRLAAQLRAVGLEPEA
jgi:hypothetical protein